MFRVIRVIINSFSFVLLLILAYVVWEGNPLLSVLFMLASIDQFEDVYYYVHRKRLFPSWFMPLDIIFEGVLAIVGFIMFFFSVIYYAYFETWFFKAVLFISLSMIYSAVEDIVMWRSSFRPAKEMMSIGVYPKEIRKKKMFVKRKE